MLLLWSITPTTSPPKWPSIIFKMVNTNSKLLMAAVFTTFTMVTFSTRKSDVYEISSIIVELKMKLKFPYQLCERHLRRGRVGQQEVLWENHANERALFELDIINPPWSRQTALDRGQRGQRVPSLHCSLLVSELIRTVLSSSVKWSPCGQLMRRLLTHTQAAHLWRRRTPRDPSGRWGRRAEDVIGAHLEMSTQRREIRKW